MSARKGIAIAGLLIVLLIVTGLVGVSTVSKTSSTNPQKLPDGSTVRLEQLVLVSTNYSYRHNNRGRLVNLITPVLPDMILQKISSGWGSFGFGIDRATNLIAITVNRNPARSASSPLGRLRIISDKTNVYDACWGAHTLGMMGETVHGWQVRAFPRRSKTLTLQFLAIKANGGWMEAANFDVKNPAWGDFSQWKNEGVPATKTNENLAVTLAEFWSGERIDGRQGQGDPDTVARSTRLLFTFSENGESSDNWRVQKVTISDATGNRWFPYLNLQTEGFNWANQGKAAFMGALWPGEDAWKLDVEVVRSRAFADADTFAVEIPTPALNTVSTLTNEWQHEGVTLKLDGLASPGVDQTGSFQWIAKWWGDDKDKIYSLALHLEPELKGQRVSLVKAVDNTGAEIEFLEHRNQDYKEQAMFLKPRPDAQNFRLTFAMTRSRFVQFFARPNFAKEE